MKKLWQFLNSKTDTSESVLSAFATGLMAILALIATLVFIIVVRYSDVAA